MEITHNNINNAVAEMEAIVSKGQPFAKQNKDRRVRAVLRNMRIEQRKQITARDVWFYFKEWLFGNLGRFEKTYNRAV